MAVFDTGPIDNRERPRTAKLAIRLSNSGRLPATAGVEAYYLEHAGDGTSTKKLYVVELVSLNPFQANGDSFTLDNVFADLDVFGVRVITSGLGANDIAVTVLEQGSDGQIIDKHILEGELSRIQELLFAYVTNPDSDIVTVVHTGTNTVVTTIRFPAGSSPLGIAITPDGTRAFVTNSGNPDSVSIIDTATNTIAASIPFPAGSDPTGIAITPDGSRAYVSNNGTPDSVSVIDTATNTIITTILLSAGSNPTAIEITPDGTRAYVANIGVPDSVTVIDTVTNAIETTILFPAGSDPRAVAITPDGTRAYVANAGTPESISVIDTATNMIVSTIPFIANSDLLGIAITPDGTRAYTSTNFNTVVVINIIGSNSFLATVPVPTSLPTDIAFTPDGSRAFVTGVSSTTVIDTASNTVIADLPAGIGRGGVAITPILLF